MEMAPETMNINAPVWSTTAHLTAAHRTSPGASTAQLQTFQETWYLNLNHPTENRALSLKFAVLISANGFRRISEITAIYFQKNQDQEPLKVALRQRHEIDSFFFSDSEGIRIGECELSENRTFGKIQSKGHSITWNFAIAPRPRLSGTQDRHYELLPSWLKKAGLIKNSVFTTHTDLTFTGTCEIDGETLRWDHCPGMQGHQSGPRSARSWIWGHCNSFTDEQGVLTPLVFEGLSSRTRWLGWIPSPRVTSLYFRYQGKSYLFDSIKDPLKIRSSTPLNEWNFQAEEGELSFRGSLKAQHKDFAGITLEDTNGSLIYCSSTKVAELSIHVYRRGKLEGTFQSSGGAAFEIASRKKNPYIPQLI